MHGAPLDRRGREMQSHHRHTTSQSTCGTAIAQGQVGAVGLRAAAATRSVERDHVSALTQSWFRCQLITHERSCDAGTL